MRRISSNTACHWLGLRGFDGDLMFNVDDRRDYGETRYRAFGRVNGAGRCLAFTLREDTMRLISFRRAHDKEMRRYE